MTKSKIINKSKKAKVTVVVKAPRKNGKGKRHAKRVARKMQFAEAPVARTYLFKSKVNQRPYRRSGSSFIATLDAPAGVVDGTIIYESLIGPQLFPGAELNTLSRTFAKYKFTKFDVMVGGNVPSTAVGGYIAGISPDPASKISSNPKNTVMSLDGAVAASLWKQMPCSLDCKRAKPLFTTPVYGQETPVLDLYQGKLYVVANGTWGGYTGTIPFPIECDWEIEFTEPIYRPDPGTAASIEMALPIDDAGAVPKFLMSNQTGSATTTSGFYFVSSSGSATQPTLQANEFIEELYDAMQPYSTCIYVAPYPADLGETGSTAAIILYKTSFPNVIFVANTLAQGYAGSGTVSSTGGAFDWFSRLAIGGGGMDTTLVFEAIRNPSFVGPITSYGTLQTEKHRLGELERPAPTAGQPQSQANTEELDSKVLAALRKLLLQ